MKLVPTMNAGVICPDAPEVECIARQLETNGYRIFAGEIRRLWQEVEMLRQPTPPALLDEVGEMVSRLAHYAHSCRKSWGLPNVADTLVEAASLIERLAPNSKGEHMEVTDEMVNRFLTWPLPESVCADLVATRQCAGRTGTNLLSAIEAMQMLQHVLDPVPPQKGST